MTAEFSEPTDSRDTEPLGAATDDDAAPQSVDEALAATADTAWGVALGDGMDDAAASRLMLESRVTVVVLAGGIGSGKSTIYCTLFEKFSDGPFAGRLFGGSKTLRAFESICHLGRVASGREYPGTKRTGSGQPPWLHLRLAPLESPESAHEVLLADVSGERFEKLIHGSGDSGVLNAVGRADHLSIALDGEKLLDPAKRHAEKANAMNLARRVIQDGLVSEARAIDFVVTKWDKAVMAGSEAAIRLVSEVEAVASGAGLPHAPIIRTAARSETSNLPGGHGLAELLDQWLESARYAERRIDIPPFEAKSAFERFRPSRSELMV